MTAGTHSTLRSLRWTLGDAEETFFTTAAELNLEESLPPDTKRLRISGIGGSELPEPTGRRKCFREHIIWSSVPSRAFSLEMPFRC